MRRLAKLAVLATMVLGATRGSAQSPSPGAPRACGDSRVAAAADSLASRFDDHQFVFIGSTHGDLKIEQFLTCLVTRPAFASRATDIVVEWASGAHQQLLDRYTLALDSIADRSLMPMWLDTDSPTLWATLPQVREFVHTLKAVNHTLPLSKRIRLIGGNEVIPWAGIRAVEDLAPYPYRTNRIPHVLVEHLAKEPGNRTLVVYGDCHIHYGANNFMLDLADALGRERLFVVGRIGELTPEDRAFLTATSDPRYAFFVPATRIPRSVEAPPSLRVCGEDAAKPVTDYIDGLVYLGPTADRSLVGAIPLTTDQQRELARRSAIMADRQQTMRVRHEGKSQWFRAHPNDFPRRPALATGPRR